MISLITNLFRSRNAKTAHSAFTLSEVVVAIAVLGVIATTVTSVVYFSKNASGYKNKDLVATLQNQVVKLNRAYKIALVERDDLDRWVDGSTKMSTTSDKTALFAKVWESYSPSTKSCGKSTDGNCFPKSTKSGSGSTVNYNSKDSYYKIITADGASVAFKIDDPMCNGTGVTGKEKGVCGEIIVDVNGNKAPNQEGLDTFRLGVYHNGIRTFSAGCADPLNSASVMIATGESCYEDFNVKVCPKDTPFKCRNCSGQIICTKNEAVCSATQKSEGCLAETCGEGTVSYYIDGKIQCITETQKTCYETIKQNPEYSWDAVKKECLGPQATCEKLGGYWDSGKEICWDSEQHMCETKHMVYDATRTAGDRCISQNDYCTKSVKNGGLGGWLWSSNVCCTATSVNANTEAVCCSNYISKSGQTDAKTLKRAWWGTHSCCSSKTEDPKDNTTEECCKSDPKGGYWIDGKCYKSGEEHCTTQLNGTWIASKNQCCTTGVMSNSNCSEVKCYRNEAEKCRDASPCGSGGKWVSGTCCTSDTSSETCCEGTFKQCNGKNKCFKSDKEYCTTSTAECGIGGWWDPKATASGEYTTVKGCCTNTNTKVCCHSKSGQMNWWNGSSCCTGETTKECCNSTENGHEPGYWTGATTGNPSVCWKNASNYCISSSGLKGWVFLEADNTSGNANLNSIYGVCCTDVPKTTTERNAAGHDKTVRQSYSVVTNDSGNGNIKHQGQYDRRLDDNYSKLCCINNSSLNGHNRWIWYTGNYADNTGYCWKDNNEICQAQTDVKIGDKTDDHGFGGWLYYSNSGTPTCCSDNSYYAKGKSITVTTKTNESNPTKNSNGTVRGYETYNFDVRNQKDYSSENCCTVNDSRGGHTRFNWINSYCWDSSKEYCEATISSGASGWYYSGWDSGTQTYNCCTTAKTANNTILVKPKAGTTQYYITYKNQSDASTRDCCVNTGTQGRKYDYTVNTGHTAVSVDRRGYWTSKNNTAHTGYCWGKKSEYCTSNLAEGLSGWDYDITNDYCCTAKTGMDNTLVWTTNQSSATMTVKRQDANNGTAQKTNSTKYCCVSANRNPDTGVKTAKASTHIRKIWTDNNYAGKNGGFCWFDYNELCQAQTGNTYDHGMGGWLWDSGNKKCCTNNGAKTVATQNSFANNKETGNTDTVNVLNQSNSSSKDCCTVNDSRGGHTRFNWINSYCWDSASEYCTSANGSGATGWYYSGWDTGTKTYNCCTTGKTANKTILVEPKVGTDSYNITYKNQSNASTRDCCVNTGTQGRKYDYTVNSGHAAVSVDRRGYWTSSNNTAHTGYCWGLKSEYCTSTLSEGLSGWDYDTTNDYCCTAKTGMDNTLVWTTNQSSATMTVKRQDANNGTAQNSNSTKYCCVSANRNPDTGVETSNASSHTRKIWTDGNYKNSQKGFCWDSYAELCEKQTGNTYDHGMGGWLWDSDNKKCCTNQGAQAVATQNTFKNNKETGNSDTVNVLNQSSSSSINCCTSAETKGGHTRFNWINSYCWDSASEYCTSTNGSGASGWYYDSSSNVCCTTGKTAVATPSGDNGASGRIKVNPKSGSSTYHITYKNQSNLSTKTCCTNANAGPTGNKHTRFNWINSYCWDSASEYCTSTNGSGASGWYYSGWDTGTQTYNCCTTGKTANKYVGVDPKAGSTAYNITFKNQSNASTKDCCTHNDSGHTRFNWINSYCWDSASEYCTTGTSGSGAGGYAYDSTNKVCCTTNKTANGTVTVSPKSPGSNYTITFKNSASSGGTSTEYCCKATYGAGKYKVCNNNCYHTEHDSSAACSCFRAGSTYCYANSTCYHTEHDSAAACSCFTGGTGCYANGTCYHKETDSAAACSCFRSGTGCYSGSSCYHGQHDSKEACSCYHSGNYYYYNSKCWSSKSSYCTTSTSSSGLGGAYQDGDVCCKKDASNATATGYKGATATYVYTRGQGYSSTCCSKTVSNSWYKNSTCCTSDNSSACCRNTWCQSACRSGSGTCSNNEWCTSATQSENCCKNVYNKSWYSGCCTNGLNTSLACCKGLTGESNAFMINSGSFCCPSIHASESCCTGKNASYKFISTGGMTCCTSQTDSDKCCKKFKGNDYELKNGSCVPKCSGTMVGSECCTSATQSQNCCTGLGNSYYSGCCTSGAHTSSACCTGMWGSDYEYKNGSCTAKPQERACSYMTLLGTSCLGGGAKNVSISLWGKCTLKPNEAASGSCADSPQTGMSGLYYDSSNTPQTGCGYMRWEGCTNCTVYTQNSVGTDPIKLQNCDGKKCEVCGTGWSAHAPCNGEGATIVLGTKPCSNGVNSNGTCK